MTDQSDIQAEALSRARHSESAANYPAIFEGLMEKGIAEADIHPRENVFTYHAWRGLGRQVRRGEKGVPVVTWIVCDKKDAAGEVTDTYRRPKTAHVFHITQTDEAD